MKSPFDVLPGIANPKLPFEPYPGATGVIGQVFGNTDTSYEFFWYLELCHARSDLESDAGAALGKSEQIRRRS